MINLLEPYQNKVEEGESWLGLEWSTGGMKKSIAYLHALYGEVISFDDLIRIRLTDIGCRALLFGAMQTSIDEFEQLFPDALEDKYVLAMIDGLTNYLPEVSSRYGDLDNSYPDIRPPVDADGKDPFDWPFMYVELKKLGFSVVEIDRLTWRNMVVILGQAFGLKREGEHWILRG